MLNGHHSLQKIYIFAQTHDKCADNTISHVLFPFSSEMRCYCNIYFIFWCHGINVKWFVDWGWVKVKFHINECCFHLRFLRCFVSFNVYEISASSWIQSIVVCPRLFPAPFNLLFLWWFPKRFSLYTNRTNTH